jgi:hypothetical protein
MLGLHGTLAKAACDYSTLICLGTPQKLVEDSDDAGCPTHIQDKNFNPLQSRQQFSVATTASVPS